MHDDGLLAAGVPDDVTDRHERANARCSPSGRTPRTAPPAAHPPAVSRSPVRILGTDRSPASSSSARATPAAVSGDWEQETLDVGLVVRPSATPQADRGLPFDTATGPCQRRRQVVDATGRPCRGSTSRAGSAAVRPVIGTNKHDAVEVAASVLADLPALPPPAHPDPDDLAGVLAEHGVRPVDWTAWLGWTPRRSAWARRACRAGQGRGARGDARRGARLPRPASPDLRPGRSRAVLPRRRPR